MVQNLQSLYKQVHAISRALRQQVYCLQLHQLLAIHINKRVEASQVWQDYSSFILSIRYFFSEINAIAFDVLQT